MTRSRPANRRPSGSTRARTTPEPDTRRRILGLLIVFLVIGATMVGVLVDLQTVRPDRYRALGEDQRTRTRELAGYRGSLVDRNGFVLAASTTGRELIVDPTMIIDPSAASAVLAPAIGLDESELTKRLTPDQPNDRFELLTRTSDDKQIAMLSELLTADKSADTQVLRGVFLQSEEERVYPAGTLARPVVGQVDDYEQGFTGLEAQFNDVMTGTAGWETSERGIFGSIAGGFWEVEPAEKGYDLVLTIDHRIQFITEQALIEHCEELSAKSAQAVISDPLTGEILAMANVIRQEDGTCVVPRYNAPLIESFEPGSVLKILAAAAAVEELGYDRNTLVEVPASVKVGDTTFLQDPGFVPAPYPLSEVIAQSLNVGTITVAQRLGNDTLYDYYRRFGFAQYSGLDWEGESKGKVRPVSEWQGADPGSMAIGQGVTANTVQIMSAYNTLANDGMYVAPRLVKAVVGADGVEYDLAGQEARRVVSANTADEVTSMLVDVVDHGTGTAAAVKGYTVAGKTGTAWKVFQGEDGKFSYGSPGNRRYVLSFAGYLPADDPRVSIVVTVDEPDVGGFAGRVAAPVFADIAQYAVRILDVPPDNETDLTGGLVRGTPAPTPTIPPTDLVGGGSKAEVAVEASGSDSKSEDDTSAGGSTG